MIKKLRVIIFLFSALIFFCQGYCQNITSGEQNKSVRGIVVDVDWVGNKFVVRTSDFGAPDEITFLTSEDTRIIRGTENLGPADLEISNKVEVEYTNSLIGLKALRISVNESIAE